MPRVPGVAIAAADALRATPADEPVRGGDHHRADRRVDEQHPPPAGPVGDQAAEATTLADIARAAGVPLGNVYYYFKAKSDIIAAVIEMHAGSVRSMLAGLEASQQDPAARLKELFAALAGEGEMVARYGCPHGTLCQELARHTGDGSRRMAAWIDSLS